MGHTGQSGHGVEPEQEDLRSKPGRTGRSWTSTLRLPRRRRLEAELGCEVRNVSLLVAIGVSAEGHREILGICEVAKEDKAGWSACLAHLKQRGLARVQLVISDACPGLVESVAEFYPEALWQRCVVHRNAGTRWSTRRYLDVSPLQQPQLQTA